MCTLSLDNYQRGGRGRWAGQQVVIHRIGICGRFNMTFNDFAAVRLKHQWRVDFVGLD